MTEQQAQSPIDDLYRKTFENLPDSAAESGWDTPSDHVWEQIQSKIKVQKGWGIQSLAIIASIAITLGVGLYLLFGQPTKNQVANPSDVPAVQPTVSPSTSETPADVIAPPTVLTPKPSTGKPSEKSTPSTLNPRNSTEEQNAKPGNNAAQPLPGSKQSLPPNSTEAQKKKPAGN